MCLAWESNCLSSAFPSSGFFRRFGQNWAHCCQNLYLVSLQMTWLRSKSWHSSGSTMPAVCIYCVAPTALLGWHWNSHPSTTLCYEEYFEGRNICSSVNTRHVTLTTKYTHWLSNCLYKSFTALCTTTMADALSIVTGIIPTYTSMPILFSLCRRTSDTPGKA